ncbi:hypothetical protein BSKO_08535 [Bryopsis sp. KO-2023]|nr:hypothetical protein BSKO_08535 [Bryopsis sp. KO-2023]
MEGHGEGRDEQQLLDQVKMELQMAYLQEFYETVREKCFEKCVTRPGSSLGRGEQQCLSHCFDRYTEATQKVQEAILDAHGVQ